MNIQGNMPEKKIDKILKELKLSPGNHRMAYDYLTAEQRDDTLLDSAEQVNFKAAGFVFLTPTEQLLEDFRKHDPERLERVYKLLWAIGRSTCVFLVQHPLRQGSGIDQQIDWQVRVLGKAPCAAMYAEALGISSYREHQSQWLHQMAATEPAVLEEAQSMSNTSADNMKLILSATLLCECDDAAVVRRQSELLLACNIENLPLCINWMSPDQLSEVERYIRAGDLGAPLPDCLPMNENYLALTHCDPTMGRMLGLCSYYAMLADPRAHCALRVYLRLYPKEVMMGITYLGRNGKLNAKFHELLRDTPGGAVSWLRYLSGNISWMDEKTRIALMRRCGNGVGVVLKYADPGQYVRLVSVFPEAEKYQGDERERIVKLTEKCIIRGKAQVRDFLMGTGSLKNARKELEGAERTYQSPTHAAASMLLYRMDHGWDNFTCRCAVVLGLVFDGHVLANLLANRTMEDVARAAGTVNTYAYFSMELDNLADMLTALAEQELPFGDIMTIAGYLHENTYNEKKQAEIRAMVHDRAAKTEFITDLCEAVRTGSLFARQMAVKALDEMADESPEARAGVLTAAGDSSKQIRGALVPLLAGRPGWIEDYKGLLSSKKAAVRILAAEVLGKLGEREVLEAALVKEKNAKAADAIRAILGAEAAAPKGAAVDMAAELLKGSKLKKLSWLLNEQLISPQNADGTAADDSIRNAILLSYCELDRIGRSDTAAALAKDLDPADLAKLAVQVYDIWFAAGAQAKQKWVLPFAAVYGGAAMTERLRKAIHDWPEHQRGAIACDAVMALALSSDPAAIMIVDSISRKFKFRQVKTAAAAALENAARELGISAEELADRIVPDLGFGRDGKRVFNYGKRSFTVRLTAALELEIISDQGKTVKTMPAPGKTDDPMAADAYEAFKAMKKGIKTTVAAQRARLEAALSVLRCWDTDRWRALFVDNPIMHQFAISLVWGVYEDGKLTDTFRYMEDGTFNTVDEEEYTLPEKAKIGLVHPVELDGETLDCWKQQLEDYEIRQSIDQLSRTVHALEESKAGEKTLEDFGGKMLNCLSLSGKLLQQGWYRGSIVDGGFYYTYYREDTSLGIGAELRFSGNSVGYDDGENVTVYDVIFYTGTIRRGSYVYDRVPEEQIIPLGQVPVRYYSEIIHQLTRATVSSTETDENWKKDRQDQ